MFLPSIPLPKPQDAKERAERRARDECPYEIVPSAQLSAATGELPEEKPQLPGYLGTYGVDCKQVISSNIKKNMWISIPFRELQGVRKNSVKRKYKDRTPLKVQVVPK